METETPTLRAAPSGGSALPAVAAEQRVALLRYAARLLDEEAAQAGEVVEAALANLPEGRRPGETETTVGGDEEEPDDRREERLFAAVRRVALRRRRAGTAPLTAAADGEEPATLGQRIEGLTPKQREAVTLKFAHGFSYESIASITGLSVHNVGFLLHSALTHLREATARNGPVVEAEDSEISDYVLDEMDPGRRSAFERRLRSSTAAKTAVREVRALAGELRRLLEVPRRSGAKSRKKRAGAAWWTSQWKGIVGALVVLAAIGGGVLWFAPSETEPARPVVREESEIRMKPDSWQLAQGREERDAPDVRPVPSEGGGGTRPAKVGGSKPEDVSALPSEDPGRVPLPPGGPGGAGNPSSPSAASVAESGGKAAGSPAGPMSPSGAAKTGSAPGSGGAPGPGTKAGVEGGAPGGAKPGGFPSAPGGPRAPAAAASAGGPGSGGGASAPSRGGSGRGVSSAGAPSAAVAEGGADGVEERGKERDFSEFSSLRDAIKEKRWPEPDTVTPEALLSYVPFEGATVPGETGLTANVEVAEAPWAPERLLVRVVVTGAPPPIVRQATANLVLLIDVSGSMEGTNRLPLVQEAARRLLRDLRPEDRVGLVTYAAEAKIVLPSTPMARGAEVLAALAGLKAEGLSHGSAGLRRAYEVARQGRVAGGVNRVVLCTDGDFNLGVTNERELGDLVEAEARGGVELAVFGFGRGRQIDPKLEALAARGRGGSGNLNTRRDAEQRMVPEVSGWRVPLARDVRVSLEADAARVAGHRLVGGGDQFLPSEAVGRSRWSVGQLARGQSVTALFEVLPVVGKPAAGRASSGALGLAVHIHHDSLTGAPAPARRIPVSGPVRRFAEASPDFKFSAAVAGLAMALRSQPPSRERLAEVVAWAESAADSAAGDPGGFRAEFLELAREARALAEESGAR